MVLLHTVCNIIKIAIQRFAITAASFHTDSMRQAVPHAHAKLALTITHHGQLAIAMLVATSTRKVEDVWDVRLWEI
jgi:hypothetical protein